MASPFNAVIHQTRASTTPLRLASFCPSHKKLTRSRFLSSWFSRPQRRPFLQNLSSSAAKTDLTSSDIEKTELQNHSNGSGLTSTSTDSAWLEFARNVSGEWDGFGADFSTEGSPIELPESVVPGAFREWEVKVFDWQTQCPTLADSENHILHYKLIKLLPTVGCEADAATRYTIDERNVEGVTEFAYRANGSYVSVWPVEEKGSRQMMELEHCLVNPQDRESRVRVIQVIRKVDEKIVLQGIRVFVEQWYGPFRNGEQLGGCSIRDSAFASMPALTASEVVGVWKSSNVVARFGDGSQEILQQFTDGSNYKSPRYESDIVLLPKQLWCSFKESKEGDTCCEAGWLLSPGQAITSNITLSTDATIKEVSQASETLEGI